MRHLIVCLALLLASGTASAEDNSDPLSFEFDARDFALSFRHGPVQWRLEALDLLKLPVVEPFDGITVDEHVLLTQELLEPRVEFDDDRRFFLSITIGW